MYAEILRALYGDLEALWGIWRLRLRLASGGWRLAAAELPTGDAKKPPGESLTASVVNGGWRDRTG